MKVLTSAEVHARSVESLGLEATSLDLLSVEAVASALRRAAGFLCPCSRQTLIQGVMQPFYGLADDLGKLRDMVEEILEALVSHGDLLELSNVTQDAMREHSVLLYAAPPSFVRRKSGAFLLLGVTPDYVSPFPQEIERHIEYVNHVRLIRPDGGIDFGDYLAELGLIELSPSAWSRVPKQETAAQHITKMNRMLAEAPASGDVPGLVLLDYERPVRYYRGRWVELTHQTGRFVGRRAQAYGADLWCYVEVKEGHPVKLLDFPLGNSVARGCDDAWLLQMAIDHERGRPQVFRVRQGPSGSCLMDFFSPIPMWARRRWDTIGEPVLASGCLSYKFLENEIDEEMSFAAKELWLAAT